MTPIGVISPFGSGDAEARGFSSRSSFRSFSSRSVFSRSRSKTSYKSRSSKSRYSSKSKSKTTSRSKAKVARTKANKVIGIKRQKKNSKLALTKFKKPKQKVSYTKVKSNNKVASKVSNKMSPKELRSYHTRRENFYSGYNPPTYVYNSSPAFGAWDAMFLWMLLDRPNYHSTYYHHMNDPGFQQWRHEAEKLSSENAELKAKLNKLDSTVAQMTGTPRDSSFVPTGVSPDLMLSEDVVAGINKELSMIRLATANVSGNYHAFGKQIHKHVAGLNVNLVPTHGSLDNLQRLVSGKVDAALAQSDAFKVFQKENPKKAKFAALQGVMYTEFVHLLANRKSKIDNLSDVDAKTVVLVEPDSGASVTWKAFGIENSQYTKLESKPVNAKEAILKVASDPKYVMLYVSGLNSDMMKLANKHGDRLKLINIKDKALDNAKDQFGNKIYSFAEIPSETYGELQDGWFSTEINTVAVDAVMVVSEKWKEKQGEGALDLFSDAVLEALPNFKKQVNDTGWF